MRPEVVVLRYGHRIVRDYRVTSHCCLVARAFGADEVIIDGSEDKSLMNSVEKIVGKFGGNFKVSFTGNWLKKLKELKKSDFKIVHLTMYGLPLESQAKGIRKLKKAVVVIGSQKVERQVYEIADYNISVTQQPHSEIAALAVFLDWFFDGKELGSKFENAKIMIKPMKKGKCVVASCKE